ncbi:mfs transporter [Neofusicoccum parvum]|nr:mfs transporter [Neofusicoccum parvum]
MQSMAPDDAEKGLGATHDQEVRERANATATAAGWGEEKGDGDIRVLVDAHSSANGIKTTSDGKIVLIPQPSDDSDDPLNWSRLKKHVVFAALIMPSFLADFGISYGAVTFEKQAETWDVSVAKAANSISGAIFMQGVGGLFAVPFTERYGRLPVLFWSQLLALAVVIAATLSPTYASFTAARTLQGLFNTPPQVIGLTVIHDMFFFHERTRKINIWCISFLFGPLFAPVMSSLILSRIGWREDFGILAGMYGLSLLLVVAIGDETAFDRKSPRNNLKTSGMSGRLALLTGVTGWRTRGRPGLGSVFLDIFQVHIRPQILLPTVGFYMVLIMWTIGFINTLSQILYPAPYFFTPVQVGLFYLAPCLGALVGQLYGHWFNDWLCARYVRKHGGKYRPESRLWGCYVGLVFGVVGLVLYGQALQHQLSWAALAVAYGVYAVAQGNDYAFPPGPTCLVSSLVADSGLLPVSVSVAITAYCLDSFPNHSVIASAIVNMW